MLSYDPQLLLTDQRSPEKKLADKLVEAVLSLCPRVTDMFTEIGRFHTGGFVSPTAQAPRLFDPIECHSREHVVLASGMDFAEIEMRMLAAMSGPGHTIVIDIETDADGRCEIRGRPGLIEETQRTIREIKDDRVLAAITGKDYLRFDPTKQVTRKRPW